MNKILYCLMVAVASIALWSCGDKSENKGGTYSFENKYTSDLHTPVIRMNLNGSPRYWIVDTGANMSIIDSKYYHDNEGEFTYLTDIDLTLNGVSGSKSYEAFYVSGKIGDSIVITHQFLTNDLAGVRANIKDRLNVDVIGILGADYLDRYSYTVDFYNKSLYIHKVPLDSIK